MASRDLVCVVVSDGSAAAAAVQVPQHDAVLVTDQRRRRLRRSVCAVCPSVRPSVCLSFQITTLLCTHDVVLGNTTASPRDTSGISLIGWLLKFGES